MGDFARRSILVAVAAALTASAGVAAGRPKVGAPAPNFRLVTIDRQKFSLADLKGKVVVLNYWATWCGPCKRELPVLENYYRRHPGTDLKIFAVDIEDSVPEARFKPLAAMLSFPLVHWLGGGGYGLIGDGVPTSYVIDRAGIVRYAASGAFDDESFDAVVTPLLGEPPPSAPAGPPASPKAD